MRIHMKAVLLSAFVLPGLGQLYKGDKVKGAILILLVNLFLLIALFLVIKTAGPAIFSAKFSGTPDTFRLLDQLQSKSPAARWPMTFFSCLWLYGVIDAALSGPVNGATKD